MKFEEQFNKPLPEEMEKTKELMTEKERKTPEEREKESLFQKLESMNKIRISEVDAMAEDIITLGKF